MPKHSTRSGPYVVRKSGQSTRSGPIAHGATTDKRGGGTHSGRKAVKSKRRY